MHVTIGTCLSLQLRVSDARKNSSRKLHQRIPAEEMISPMRPHTEADCRMTIPSHRSGSRLFTSARRLQALAVQRNLSVTVRR